MTILNSVPVLVVNTIWLNVTSKWDYNKVKEGFWLKETINVLKATEWFCMAKYISKMWNI